MTQVTYFKPRKSFSLSTFNVKIPFSVLTQPHHHAPSTATVASCGVEREADWLWKRKRLAPQFGTTDEPRWPFRGEIRAIRAAATRLKFVLRVKGCVPTATFDALQDEHAWLSAPWTGHSAESRNRSRCVVSACVGAVLFIVF